MPLVFVHGVSVRKDAAYDARVRLRDSLFRRFCLKQIIPAWATFDIKNPYWGDVGAQFKWNFASLPEGDQEVLGAGDDANLLDEAVPTSNLEGILVSTARSKGLVTAIDMLWEAASCTDNDEFSAQLAQLAEQALEYARTNPRPTWLARLADDQDLITSLKDGISGSDSLTGAGEKKPQMEMLGLAEIWDRLREGAGRIATAIPATGSAGILFLARRRLHVGIATFLGDVLVYIHERDEKADKSPIIGRILESLDSADKTRSSKQEPLIVVAHSMGGIILYDVLTHYRPNLRVDLFVTVGSQSALFEELKLFKVSDPTIPNFLTNRVHAPQSVSKWLNVFDTNDILSFSATGVFSGVSDFKYSTGKDLFHAHSSYFNRPSFQERLGARIQEVWAK
jgi:hypothetical protein